MEEATVFVGVDWAHSKHQVCVLDGAGHTLDERIVDHNAEDLAKLCDRLTELAGGELDRVAVAIETTHGIVVETLLDRGISVWSINPKQLDRFRDRFSMSGAKDDRRDARVLADSLRTDRRAFRRLQPLDPKVVELREWTRMHADVQQDRSRLTNQVRDLLRRYFPAFVQLNPDLGAAWVLDVWEAARTPAEAARVTKKKVQGILRKHRISRVSADDVLSILRTPEMTTAPGTVTAACAHMHLLVERLRTLNEQLKRCAKRLQALLDEIGADDPEISREQRDVTILRSLPGVGPIVAATLLAEAGVPLAARDYHATRSLAGVAPVTKRSGKRTMVVRRHACNPRLREAVYHAARVSSIHVPSMKAAYASLKARGHSHGRALRTIGDRLLRILFAMLRNRTPYRADAAAA